MTLTKFNKNWYFNLQLIHGSWGDGSFWVRITNGIGIKIKDTTKHRLMFSERNGFSKSISFGKWHISKIEKGKA